MSCVLLVFQITPDAWLFGTGLTLVLELGMPLVYNARVFDRPKGQLCSQYSGVGIPPQVKWQDWLWGWVIQAVPM